ncbi:MAG: diaminopimelate epimerase, partial [Saprospiraceae bacterium]|nr:diaminopimelate epimerase [Saprospiraceae bacterium]
FIIIDQRKNKVIDHQDQNLIENLCNRRFGIGGDGLILLENSSEYDFNMVYFNADGKQSTMCGNGGRCIVQFAKYLGIIGEQTKFEAIDGLHTAKIIKDENVSLQMRDVNNVECINSDIYILDTGSPHYIKIVEQWPDNIKTAGAQIRYSTEYFNAGINVNFVKWHLNGMEVATYERGVEDETLSCGTGVVAAALAGSLTEGRQYRSIEVKTKGGALHVSFDKEEHKFINVFLTGPAKRVFEGTIQL